MWPNELTVADLLAAAGARFEADFEYHRTTIHLGINTTLPVIAIRRDLDGSPYDPPKGEYLVNPLPIEIADVGIDLKGFLPDDDGGVIESNPNQKQIERILPGQAQRYALSTWDELDEFVAQWASYRGRPNSTAFLVSAVRV
jgi:hypothetical protein